MKHFEEILLTIGGSNPVQIAETPLWAFWTVEYPNPSSIVTAAYLYLKTKCPLKEASSENLHKWASLSPTGKYEVVVPPKSQLADQLKQTAYTFGASRAQSSEVLLFDNLLASLKFKKIEEEEYFIDPNIESVETGAKKSANQVLYSWLTGSSTNEVDKNVGVLTAQGGLGKTTLCRILCNRIHNRRRYLIPLLIESSQWQSHIRGDLRMTDVWDIAISRTFERPTRLLSNELALRVLIREGLFIPIFDGFDELCLNPSADYGPEDLIDQLGEMLESDDETSQARILITTRETFWDSFADRIRDSSNICVFKLLGFSNQQEHDYFSKRLKSLEERDTATRLARQISGKIYETVKGETLNSDKPSGVPFILDMIASYVADNPDPGTVNPYVTDPLSPLLEAICRRENVRQNLGIPYERQLTFFEEIFRDSNDTITQETVDLYLQVICEAQDAGVIQRFSNHFLLRRLGPGLFEPRYEVLKVYFIARFLANGLLTLESSPKGQRRRIAETLAKNATGSSEITDWLLGQLRNLDEQRLQEAFGHAKILIAEPENYKEFRTAGGALFALIQRLIVGSSKDERTANLARFLKDKSSDPRLAFTEVVFSGSLRSYDFSETLFAKCVFVNVEFKNCNFSSNSLFRNCEFVGTLGFDNCNNGVAIHLDECSSSGHAELALDELFQRPARIETRKTFAEEALLLALRKFRGQFGFTSIQYRRRLAGLHSSNPYSRTVWEFLLKHRVIERHNISNVGDGGLNIRDDQQTRKDVRSFTDNGVLGPILKRLIDDLIL